MRGIIYRAGIVPYHFFDGTLKFLFMKPSNARYGGAAFQIAKGKIEENETPLIAATREGSEELGLIVDNLENLQLAGTFLGRTTIYSAHVLDPDRFLEPHFETKETKWMTFGEFLSHGRELHVPIIRDINARLVVSAHFQEM